MPKGPQGQKRPADVIGNAVTVMQIATGQIDERVPEPSGKNQAAAALGRLGGEARAKNLSAKKLKSIAKKAAAARWKPSKKR
jgi:hypothetical protein